MGSGKTSVPRSNSIIHSLLLPLKRIEFEASEFPFFNLRDQMPSITIASTIFWSVANDKRTQEDVGIRAAHGQANYIRVEPGKTYKFNVRASGGGSLEPVPE